MISIFLNPKYRFLKIGTKVHIYSKKLFIWIPVSHQNQQFKIILD